MNSTGTGIFNECYDVLYDDNRGNRDAGIIGVGKYGNRYRDRPNVPEEGLYFNMII